MEVYRALGSIPSSRSFSSPSARHMFEHIAKGDDEYKFVTQTVPKAAEMLAKLKPADLDEVFVEIDKKTLTDLQKCLLEAIEDSQDIQAENLFKPLEAPKTEAPDGFTEIISTEVDELLGLGVAGEPLTLDQLMGVPSLEDLMA